MRNFKLLDERRRDNAHALSCSSRIGEYQQPDLHVVEHREQQPISAID